MIELEQITKQSQYGLVINWRFHRRNRWVSAQTPYLMNAIIAEFDPIIITSQQVYEFHKKKLRYIISAEPGWAAPRIKYDKRQNHVIGVFASDPHNKTDWFQAYVEENEIRYTFSYYYHPFFFHFPNFDPDRFVHMPWALPDEFVRDPQSIVYQGQESIHIFGGAKGEAYEVRNWCRQFPFVTDHRYSGVENKVLSDEEYFLWIRQFDAIIAAGSLKGKYQLVTPKYFEICAGGALLFAQHCPDLEVLGFTSDNCLIFDLDDFEDKATDYLSDPSAYIEMRRRGCRLIQKRHKISDRVKQIRELMPG